MKADLRSLITHAADLLMTEAKLTRQSCAVEGRDWACLDCRDKTNCSSREAHDDFLITAKRLRKAIR